ncbi:hypothetical protein [Kitasatospora sp. LaBMicrA B282]|uniref:hypothetical protein n=1 Tax=Kitasatospora sp. LaBMicrA B282 TaxID=3420949 RepID=UPI003D0EE467
MSDRVHHPARRVAIAAGATAAALLAGVGLGLGILHRSAPTPPRAAPAPTSAPIPAPTSAATAGRPAFGVGPDGVHFGSLRDLLLPVPAGFTLGPDDAGQGDDTELTADQLGNHLDELVKELPEGQRAAVKSALQAAGDRAAGVRSYRTDDGRLAATLWLDQLAQPSTQAGAALTGAPAADPGLFRDGPLVPDHPEARCFQPQLDPAAPLDGLQCTAQAGDLLVTMHVEGVAPLPLGEAVALFHEQLRRLALPGGPA